MAAWRHNSCQRTWVGPSMVFPPGLWWEVYSCLYDKPASQADLRSGHVRASGKEPVARHLKTTDHLFDSKGGSRTESMVAAAVQG